MTRRTRTPESLWRTINKSTVQQGDHLIWTGTTSQGYTKIAHHINDNGTTISRSAVRVIWELSVGPLPSEHWLRRKPTCDEPLCVNPDHYQPHDTTAPKPAPERKTPPTLAERIQRRTQPGDDGCLIWTGSRDSDGYPKIILTDGGKRRQRPVHHVYWELTIGPLTGGESLARMNGCTNRRCINPEHLVKYDKQVTAAVLSSMLARGLSINPAEWGCGHPRTPENTAGKLKPTCRTCSKARALAYEAALTPEQREARAAYHRNRRARVKAGMLLAA